MALKEKNKKVTKKKTKKNTKVAGKVIPIKPGQPFAARNVHPDDNPYSEYYDGLNEGLRKIDLYMGLEDFMDIHGIPYRYKNKGSKAKMKKPRGVGAALKGYGKACK